MRSELPANKLKLLTVRNWIKTEPKDKTLKLKNFGMTFNPSFMRLSEKVQKLLRMKLEMIANSAPKAVLMFGAKPRPFQKKLNKIV